MRAAKDKLEEDGHFMQEPNSKFWISFLEIEPGKKTIIFIFSLETNFGALFSQTAGSDFILSGRT